MSEIDDGNINPPNDNPEGETPIEGDNPEGATPTENPEGENPEGELDDVEKLKEQNKKLFERAKKAEGFEKDADGNWVKKQPKPAAKPSPKPQAQKIEITPLDTIALMNSKVTDADDINEVLDYARFKNISVAEALKSSVVKTTLADKAAERATALATSTKGGQKGASKPDDDTIIAQAKEGKLPENPEDLAKARMAQKKSKLNK